MAAAETFKAQQAFANVEFQQKDRIFYLDNDFYIREGIQDYGENYAKLAEAFGCKGRQVSDPAELDDAIREMMDYDGPFILDVLVEKHENCFPMIPSGKPHNEMLLGDLEAAEDIGTAIQSDGAVLV